MRGIGLICFLFTLPVLAVLGHDVYHAYNDKGGIDFSRAFPFSDAGWLLTHYARDFYNWARMTIEPGFWKRYIAPILETKAIIVATAPAAAVYGLLIFMKLLGLGPFAGTGLLIRRVPLISKRKGSGGQYSFDDKGRGKKLKYKRR